MNEGRSRSPSYSGLTPASEASSRVKRSNRARNTTPELLLRRELWRLGLRYRTNDRELPGRPDVVFSTAKVVVFCDGDFWHGRDWEARRAKLERGWNAEYWLAKIGQNIERDRNNTALLELAGWCVIRLWETDIKRDSPAIAKRVQQIVDSRRAAQQRQPHQPPRPGD